METEWALTADARSFDIKIYILYIIFIYIYKAVLISSYAL